MSEYHGDSMGVEMLVKTCVFRADTVYFSP